jgi:DNA-binding CsgD family transcriptional regulator
MAGRVIGRDGELASIAAFLARAGRGPDALVVGGQPGMGKTFLWEAAVDQAQTGSRVLVHRGVETEAVLSFAGLSDLVAPVFDGVSSELPPPRRRALEVALLLAEPSEDPPDARAIGLGLLDVLRALARTEPVVVALDDVQWLDPSSAAVLRIALRRLQPGEPVGLLATLRAEQESLPLLELERAFREGSRERLWLAPMELAALHRLLRAQLGIELARPEAARVWEASGGNPFFALELGRELMHSGTVLESGQALRVPASLHELLDGRLARVPADTRALLLRAAALARPTVELVGGELEPAVQQGVVAVDGARIRFTHPLLASICYEQATGREQRAVHRALSRETTGEERARHLTLGAERPDADVAAELDAASEQAAARGAVAEAAELADLAAGLTPGDPPAARRRRLRAARLYGLAGAGERATGMLEQLRAEAAPGSERADVLFALATLQRFDAATLIALYNEALAEAEGDDARCARLLANRTWARLYAFDIRAALADARSALGRAERVGDPELLAITIARLGHCEQWAGETTPGLLERGVAIEEKRGLALRHQESPRFVLGRLLLKRGELDSVRGILEALGAVATARGDEQTRAACLWCLSLVEWLAGRWQQALGHADAAAELTEQTQNPNLAPWVGHAKALVESDLGMVEEARASVASGLAAAEANENEYFRLVITAVLGRLELVLDDLPAADALLRELPERLLAAGYLDGAGPGWADAIETAIRLGRLEEARGWLAQHEVHSQRLASPVTIAGALRCRGLLAAAEHDFAAAFASLEQALACDPGGRFPLERARTLLCLGAARRQAKQKRSAREALEQALATFDQLGAPLWSERARTELRRISGRRAPGEELTETEERAASLAAEGRSNKEIAAELFLSVHTVEAMLSRVYRKLGVRSRSELARRLTSVEAVKKPGDRAQA